MSKRKKKSKRRSRPGGKSSQPRGRNAESDGASARVDAGANAELEADGGLMPKWIASDGNLYYRGALVFHLSAQASAERAILGALERRKWRCPVRNPLPRETIGDATQSRRSAIKNLNRHQREGHVLQFFSVVGGFVYWCAAEDLREK